MGAHTRGGDCIWSVGLGAEHAWFGPTCTLGTLIFIELCGGDLVLTSEVYLS